MIKPWERLKKGQKKCRKSLEGKKKGRTFAVPFETRVAGTESPEGRKVKKLKKVLQIKKKFLPLQPRMKKGAGKAGRKAPSTERDH